MASFPNPVQIGYHLRIHPSENEVWTDETSSYRGEGGLIEAATVGEIVEGGKFPITKGTHLYAVEAIADLFENAAALAVCEWPGANQAIRLFPVDIHGACRMGVGGKGWFSVSGFRFQD